MRNFIEKLQKEKEDIVLNNNGNINSNENEEKLKREIEKLKSQLEHLSSTFPKEMEELRKENSLLNEEITMFKSILNSHKLILEKILKKSNDNYSQNNMQKGTKNVKSINDLFSRYLYYLKIYSPFVSIENNTTVKQKMERVEASNVNESTKDNDVKNVLDNKNIVSQQIDNNNEEFFDEFSLFNSRNDYPFLDLNLHNNYSSKSFLSINKF